MLRVCSLGSGSSGNGLVVEARDGLQVNRALIDCGFNVRELRRRLQRAGLDIDALDAVFVTHEHSDHVGGVVALARRHGIPVYCTAGTAAAAGIDAGEYRASGLRPAARACLGRPGAALRWHCIGAGEIVAVGALSVLAYDVPHDASEPVQFTFSDGARRAGLLTDSGDCSDVIATVLSGLHALVLECNHDEAMLRNGPYPAFLKTRILGARGHLSNRQAAGILQRVDCSQLAWIAAAHLSKTNNHPSLARAALAEALHCAEADVAVADQQDGLAWRDV